MPVVSADVAIAGQWDYIVTKLQGEMGAGKRLSAIQFVGKSYQAWTATAPSIGVQLKTFAREPYASNRRLLKTLYWVIIAAQSTDASAETTTGANSKANLDDAMAQLRPLIGIGDGNGIIPVLDDADIFTLGGNAMKTIVGQDAQLDWEIGPGQDPEVWAYAHIGLYAETLVTI